MQIPANTIYPRTGDRETVYLNAVVSDPNISVGITRSTTISSGTPRNSCATMCSITTPSTATGW